MQPSSDGRWRELAKRISQETEEMRKFVQQLNQELDERERKRLSEQPDSAEKGQQS